MKSVLALVALSSGVAFASEKTCTVSLGSTRYSVAISEEAPVVAVAAKETLRLKHVATYDGAFDDSVYVLYGAFTAEGNRFYVGFDRLNEKVDFSLFSAEGRVIERRTKHFGSCN